MPEPPFPPGDQETESIFLPGYRNYLVYCDDSGLHGSTHYAFGSLWIPAERRGDFPALVNGLGDKHRMHDEFKWQKINSRNQQFYLDLAQTFLQNVKKAIANHLGWSDLKADTIPSEWKFNIWTFWDPTKGEERSVKTRPVRLRYPMRLVEVRRPAGRTSST